ncbi:ribonuclease D [Pasteurella langaaensis DSM 22999]|uniref:Ribonuclease D n=1 Tax=Alitibacter langaaensis DSM 22999 TaxID=1122935 RepID=A0A2U0TH91_9PAST|nr:ribonuclease D [Pasteurella langaaensis]PVX42898.1 ribonuclease D [Pasteurella langaaensis DSM 22999]
MIKELKNQPHFQLITDNESLQIACAQAAQKPVVALDTEFIRIRSFYPKLGLIQLYDGESVSLIDPNEISDFSPFIALLANEKVTKVLHACYEDLEVFFHHFQQFPTPMWDTQVMASFLGFPNSTGLATLIQHYFQLEMDKGTSRTDWLARPLSEKQLRYAAADVWYLLPLYERMAQDLQKTRWQSAVKFDCDLLIEKQNKAPNGDKAYRNIANAWRMEPEELARLQLLARWRYEEAIRRDLALNFVVRAEHLYEVAKNQPKHTSELLSLGLNPNEVRIHGKKMLQLIEQSQRIDPANYPPKIQRLNEDPRYKKTIKALQQKLKEIAPDDLQPEVIASKRGLESLMKWCWLKNKNPQKLPELMRDWRKPFGTALLNMIENQA